MMASYEYKSDKLCIVYTSREPRDRMFRNRITENEIRGKVATPKWFNEYVNNPTILIERINEVLNDQAYLELLPELFWGRSYRLVYGSYIYFLNEADAIAFKLRFGKEDDL